MYPSGSIVINTGECLTLYAPAGFQYLWSNGATTQNIQVCSTGTYSVKVIAGTCTSDASAGTSVALGTAASVTPEALGIYPNPAGGSFRIAGLANETRVRIFNSIGQVLSEEVVAPGASVNSAALPAGIYYVIVGSRSLKLVKE